MRTLFVTLLLLITNLPVQAETLPGQNDPRFQSALTQWLDGDDRKAVESLRTLALQNNLAAQMFLSELSYYSITLWPEAFQLPTSERRRLFKAPGGAFGKSWKTITQKSAHPLAQAMAKAQSPKAGDVTSALLNAGELRKAHHTLTRALQRATDPLGDITSLDIPPAFYVFHEHRRQSLAVLQEHRRLTSILNQCLPTTAASDVRRAAEHKALSAYDQSAVDRAVGPTQTEIASNQDSQTKAIAHFSQIPSVQPIFDFCQSECPETKNTCAIAILSSDQSPQILRATFSPLETVLPTRRYQASKRFTSDMHNTLKHLEFIDPYHPNDPRKFSTRLATIDHCLANTLKQH